MSNRAPVALARCCNMLISSMYRHDFVKCKCGKSFVDGGPEYRRWGGEVEWLKTADVLRPEIKKLLPAFKLACKKKVKQIRIENWEYAQRLFLDHGIATRDFFDPKPKGAKMPKKGDKPPLFSEKGLYEDGNEHESK